MVVEGEEGNTWLAVSAGLVIPLCSTASIPYLILAIFYNSIIRVWLIKFYINEMVTA